MALLLVFLVSFFAVIIFVSIARILLIQFKLTMSIECFGHVKYMISYMGWQVSLSKILHPSKQILIYKLLHFEGEKANPRNCLLIIM